MLSLYALLSHLLYYIHFAINLLTMEHPYQRAVAEMWQQKSIHNQFYLFASMKIEILGNACSFWLAFLQSDCTCVLKLSFVSCIIPSNVSSSLSSITALQCVFSPFHFSNQTSKDQIYLLSISYKFQDTKLITE